ncbi:MAG TPA: DUF2076 domain-containing protein [Acetobacteraceae bacterium]|jgi:hypothetical protein|nr:DUF2076 domain-containing protein [Acetobacteraceae bacterium]
MTNEERDIIAKFIARVAGAAPQQGAWGSGASVPATQPQLPPVDPEADRFIAEQFQAYPAARYRITQLAFVQEQALVEAQNRLRRMEWEVQQAQQAAQQSGGQRQGGGFFSNLFGGGNRSSAPPRGGPWGGQAPGQGYAYSAPPPPQYPPGYQPGLFQRAGGSGFLGSALTTAAGVAGGMLAADAIRDLFSPHHGLGGGMGEGAFLGGGVPADPGYVDQGTWTDPNAGGVSDPGYVDQGTWDQGGGGQSGWGDSPSLPDDTSGGWDQGGGGWDQGSGGGSDDSLI